LTRSVRDSVGVGMSISSKCMRIPVPCTGFATGLAVPTEWYERSRREGRERNVKERTCGLPVCSMWSVVGDLWKSGETMRIERFQFGEVVIAGQRYSEDVVVLPDGVQAGWWRKEGHLLQLADLTDALAAEPEALIVGTGTKQCMKVAQDVLAHTRKAGIEVLAFDTRTACHTFNQLFGKRKIVAVLHLTC
jgi:hypothetical protein